ncbi:tryptophan halogenase family protein [Cellvibrio sp. ARAG 10.3]|uniref:tryptophan halogenase family protein n=1 Tax=Cellvibrio sp. ARAG 10.3 TaxID=3451358 RepID=UPI003F46695A
MTTAIKSIVIVGGGAAGWITAGTLAAKILNQYNEGIQITLVESPKTPIVGVGEGTWPTMRNTLKKMNIRETDFIRECNASFKQGAKFVNWCNGQKEDFYYHPLVLPQGFYDINLVPHWLVNPQNNSFSNAVCVQETLCEAGLAPKLVSTPEYVGVANYAYHLDAGAFAEFLKKHCTTNLGVTHLLADVIHVNTAENGDIASITTDTLVDITGDLFIDCSGSNSLLLGKHYEVPFISCKDVLFIDMALAVHLPYENDNSPIASHTISTAQDSGWIWDIGLPTRRGIGHVFSSAHTSVEQAEEKLHLYLSHFSSNTDQLSVRKIPIIPGHRERFWEKNCVAVGLSAGFLEPLEASALVLIEISAAMIADQLPTTRPAMDIIAKRFNETFLYRWRRIIDFLKLHYALSKRNDSDFWRDNRHSNSIPESLQDLMTLWRYQAPWYMDFDRAVEVFPAASYQYLLYGMGYTTEASPKGMSQPNRKLAQELFNKNAILAQQLRKQLPSNRELINKIIEYGLQPI